ncbi:beta-lactamase class C [Pseudomonas sp. ok272]|uniref:class C beta-lactamase n=1 Tax=unclassified Pseudomonas TaxID=196821 RepID=UPI0008B6159A|nr:MULTISPECIES: class C beta-lactamase [unclassified Pseudomonas]SEM99992.1 beta-lactamase class C [Pseudomonas sp. ok272]SFM89116.1 beta-lactamase class C [Pseudomonas sp. ok602]
MNLIQKRCTAWLALACVSAFSQVAMAAAQTSPIDSVVQNAARDVMQRYHIPGLAIAVTHDGKRQFYNFGVASRDTQQQVTSATLFEIGSISKTFTATLATYAQANGRLSLADHPGKYLPELAGSAFDQVTLLNLATHTAGGFPLQVPDQVQNHPQLMQYFKAWTPTYPPGTQRTYANPSIGMLGLLVADSMKLPFADALEKQLFPQLGMRSSFINVPANAMPRYAQGYNKQDAPVRLNPGVLGDEAYGVKTSSADLIHFVEANLGMVKVEAILGQALAQTRVGYFRVGAMTQDLIWEQYGYPVALATLLEGNADPMILESHAVTPLSPPLPPQEAVWINKTGSTGGFSAYVAFVPSKKLGIVVLANKSYPNEARIRLAYRILSELDR